MSVTTSDMYRRMTDALVRALKDEGDEIPRLMEVLASEHMLTSSLDEGTISTAEKVHTKYGGLRRALIKGRKGNIFESKPDILNSKFEWGIDGDVIKHAMTHEYGDTRPITPKMRRFFWAMYFASGGQQEMWAGLALTKRTTITYKARPIINPALKDFDDQEFQPMLNRIFNRLAIAFNAN
jgi:hypothetical protein